jgi:uncharacterized membrane protein YbhN (UPF0104 family)
MSRSAALRRWSGPAVAAAALAAALASPQLRDAPAQLLAACTTWITIALVFESLSIGGFLVIFKLAFGDGMGWRQALVGALRGLGASGLLPAGGLIGPAAAAASVDDARHRDQTARSAIAFVIVTNVPGVIVVVALGVALALGYGAAPHDLPRTLVPVGVGLALTLATLVIAGGSASRPVTTAPRATPWLRRGLSVVRGGAKDACALMRSGDWKLLGAFGYYVFDNALLWAAFRAGGHAPSFSVVAMAYVVGSLGAVVPLPGGIGATEGGLIGALVLYGAPAGPSAAAVLLYRGVALPFTTLLGAAAWGAHPVARRRRNATELTTTNNKEQQRALTHLRIRRVVRFRTD